MTPQSKVILKNVSKGFGNLTVLKDLSLSVPQGQSLVVIGGSGSGKSVMLKCLLGLLAPDAGEIYIDGQDILQATEEEWARLRPKMGMLFQNSALFDSLSVWENVAFALLQQKGISRKEARDLALEKIKAVGLKSHTADLYPAELSGGMQRRVALARAIIAEPEILFFDEPTTGLDPIVAHTINELMLNCIKELNATAITITHDMGCVGTIADQVAFLYDQKIHWEGSYQALKTTSDPYVRQFVEGRTTGPIKLDVS